MEESQEDMEARHKKELKALDGEKRAKLKKVKSTAGKGKKGKDALAAAEAEFAEKEKSLKEAHQQQLAQLTNTDENATPSDEQQQEQKQQDEGKGTVEEDNDPEEEARAKIEKKRLKKLAKKEKQRQAEKERERQITEELANAGPTMKQLETERMMELYLKPEKLKIREVEADGHCLYRAVAAQCGDDVQGGYRRIRAICADTLTQNPDDYAPFCELEPNQTYPDYTEQVRSSAQWGGHVELRALAQGLKRKIVVYSAEAPPMTMESDGGGASDKEPVLLAFHRHYYALGEHYNCVVKAD